MCTFGPPLVGAKILCHFRRTLGPSRIAPPRWSNATAEHHDFGALTQGVAPYEWVSVAETAPSGQSSWWTCGTNRDLQNDFSFLREIGVRSHETFCSTA